MKRRKFLFYGTIGMAALSIPMSCQNFKDVVYDPNLAQAESLSMIWDTETIIEIGTHYRKLVPDENRERTLVKLLEETDFGERIKEDFENGQTIMIDGWILSITEARQCALFSTVNHQ